MVARIYPGSRSKKVGNRSYEELQRLLGSSNSPLPGGKIDMRTVPGSNQRRTGIPADTKSASQRGALPPNPANVTKTTKKPAPNTYKARGKTYIANPNDSRKIFLKNHPVLAGLKTTSAKTKFLAAHPRIANRASEVTNPKKGPALKAARNNLKAAPEWDKNALMRRFRKRYKLGQ